MNPYETLNVKSDAKREEIVRSYRKLAKKYHPDAGGNGDEFKRISEAYEVLSDPGRRKRYDETGECEKKDSNVVSTLLQFFYGTLLGIINEGRDPEGVDLIRIVRSRILQDKNKNAELARDNRERAAKIRRVIERIKTKSGGDNILATSLKSVIADLERAAVGFEETVKILEECETLLSDYRYSFDKSKAQTRSSDVMMFAQWKFINTTN